MSSVVSTRILLVTLDKRDPFDALGSWKVSFLSFFFKTFGESGKIKFENLFPNLRIRYEISYENSSSFNFPIYLFFAKSIDRIRAKIEKSYPWNHFVNKGAGNTQTKVSMRTNKNQRQAISRENKRVVASYSTNKLIRLNGLIIRGSRGVLSWSGIPRKITVRVEHGFVTKWRMQHLRLENEARARKLIRFKIQIKFIFQALLD